MLIFYKTSTYSKFSNTTHSKSMNDITKKKMKITA